MKLSRVFLALAVVITVCAAYLVAEWQAFGTANAVLSAQGYGERRLEHPGVSHCSFSKWTITFISQGGRVLGDPALGYESHGYVCVGVFGDTDVHRQDLPRSELPDWERED